ncbi:MAG: rhodanese-like domain-containing protein [Firmicutes bacterium]|nr:rhodanese-like domain-containing protein [Bacillota bacterium]
MNMTKVVLLLLIASLVLVGCGKRKSYTEMTTAELEHKLAKGEPIVLVDVREEAEYREQRIPQATLVPLTQIKDVYQQLEQDAEIVLICRSGNRSSTAAAFLVAKGYTNVANVVGGMLEWTGPVETG